MLTWILIIIGIVCAFILLFGLYFTHKKTTIFRKNTGDWKEIEKNAWHGTVSDFQRYCVNSQQYKRSGIYIHKNLDNGKCYVGQSRNIFSRVDREINGKADNAGCKALFKDYLSGYNFEIILIFQNKNLPNLNKMERAFINLHDSIKHGYNQTWGNDEISGKTIYE